MERRSLGPVAQLGRLTPRPIAPVIKGYDLIGEAFNLGGRPPGDGGYPDRGVVPGSNPGGPAIPPFRGGKA